MYILAKGKKFGQRIRIEVKNKQILINGRSNDPMAKILDIELQMRPVFAGTYIPEDAYEDVNIYNVLKNHFFDSTPEIKANSIKPMPDEGLVY